MQEQQLQEIISGLGALKSELALIAGALIFLLAGLFTKKKLIHKIIYAAVLLLGIFFIEIPEQSQQILSGTIVIGAFQSVLKILMLFFAVWLVFFPNKFEHSFERLFIILSMVIGASFMVSANHLLVVYLSIELTSFASYIITSFNFKKKSFEAGIKYLLFGGVSSAVMLYGMSIIYGLGGGMVLSDLSVLGSDPFLYIGIIAFIGGLLFKISLFPFHIWTPSVYQEAPTDAVAVMSVLPKIGGFVLLYRIIAVCQYEWLEILIAIIGIATIIVGVFGALNQKNIKRLMAYGAIAHSGLIVGCMLLTGVAASNAFLWYVVVYALMNLITFYLIAVYEVGGITEVDQFSGLKGNHTLMGALWLLAMVAMIGLPPTAGFTAKFFLFTSLWQEFDLTGDTHVLVFLIVAVISVVFSLFYYLQIPYFQFIKSGDKFRSVKVEVFAKILATILTFFLLWLFFAPELLNNIAVKFSSAFW